MISIDSPAKLPTEFTWSWAIIAKTPDAALADLLQRYPWCAGLPMAWVTSNHCLHVACDWSRNNDISR